MRFAIQLSHENLEPDDLTIDHRSPFPISNRFAFTSARLRPVILATCLSG